MERAVSELSTALVRHGGHVRVITSDIGAAHASRPDEPAPLEVRRLRSVEIAHTPVMWRLLPELRRAATDASVFHVHVAQAFIPDLAAGVARRRAVPVVAHYHIDVQPSGPLGFLLKPYRKTLLGSTLRHADAVVVPTADYADIVADLYAVSRRKIHVVPSGTTFAIRTEPKPPPGQPLKLLSVGRLAPQKNFPLLLEAVAAFGRRHPDIAFDLAIHGEGELRGELADRIRRLGLGDRVSLRRGDLGPEELLACYDAADIFVLATARESFGIVYVEAMARGLPIVTTDVPGVRNVVRQGRNGVLVAEQPDAIADALYQVATDAEVWSALSRANLEDAREYTWARIATTMERLYADVCRPAGQARG